MDKMDNQNEITNPMEYVDIHRNATVTMENHFFPASCRERGEEPLKFFSRWSHVSIALIDRNRNSLTYRIYPREMAYIRRLTDAMILKSVLNDEEKSAGSLAYSVPLAGRYQGMTAAEALAKYGEQAMASQYNYLNEHAQGNYRERNVQQMNAIREAVQLKRAGKLNDQKGKSILIFDSGLRARTSRAHQLTIRWGSGDFPVQLEIKRWDKAQIVKTADGRQQIIPDKSTVKSVKVALAASEWADMVDNTMDQIRMHKLMLFPTAYKAAVEMERAHNEARQHGARNYQNMSSQNYSDNYDDYEDWN